MCPARPLTITGPHPYVRHPRKYLLTLYHSPGFRLALRKREET